MNEISLLDGLPRLFLHCSNEQMGNLGQHDAQFPFRDSIFDVP